MELVLYFLIGGFALLLGYFLAVKLAAAQPKLEELTQRLNQKEIELATTAEAFRMEREHAKNLEITLQKREQDFQELLITSTALKSENNFVKQKLDAQKEELQQMQEKMSIQFRNLANDIFEEKSKKFTDQNKVNLSDLLNPLKEKLADFEKKVEESSKDSLKWNSTLMQQLSHMKELHVQLSKEATNLTRALKGDTKTQGNWGEYILESILEKSGLVKGREYVVQESSTVEEKRLRPDVIVNLPDNRHIVIDSKVSLIAYEQAVNAENEDDKLQQLKMHVQSMKNHIRQLSEKQYQNIEFQQGLDYVLMFIPIEPAFSIAIQHEPDIFNDAFNRRIILVSPTTLLATLRTVENIWKQEYQSRNVMEIARQAGAMYDKFQNFTEDLIKLGNQMDTSQKTYKEAMNKLTEGKGNLVRSAEKLKEMGAKASKSINPKLLERAGTAEDSLGQL
jgi:DNA recombination protein RmuC